jgi:hypothetical protein
MLRSSVVRLWILVVRMAFDFGELVLAFGCWVLHRDEQGRYIKDGWLFRRAVSVLG